MAPQIMLSSDKKRVAVAPGAKTDFTITIQNLTTLLDDVAVSVAGIDPGWVEVVPAHVPVFAQGEASVRVIIQPPLDPARSVAGVYSLQISGRSQELAGQPASQLASASLELEVQFGGDYRLEVGAGTPLSLTEATFPIRVRNGANAPLNLRVSGADPQNQFWYKVDPFQLAVPAGGMADAVLSIRSRQDAISSQALVFTLSAQGEWTVSGMAPETAPAHAASGQWGQAAPTTLGVEVQPYPADTSGRARYQVVVSNPGPTAEAASLEGSSADGLLGFQFDPPQIQLAPQSKAAVNLLVWLAQNANARAIPQSLEFWVTARPLGARTRPGSLKARFTPATPRKRPGWLVPLIIIVVLAVLLCLAVVAFAYLYQTR